MSRLLEDRAVVITGAGSGLGRSYALACAEAGAAVVVGDVDPDAAAQTVDTIIASGGRAVAVIGSVASWEVARRLVGNCLDEFGRIDGMVTNAGIKHEAPPWEETEELLREIVDVNVLGVQFTARWATRAMIESGRGGAIVNVVSGARAGIRGMSAYGATKGAVASMTRNWAIEGARHGIRVNAISPLGLTRMALADTRPDRPDLPDPATVAPAVVALLAAEDVTGQIIRFDGSRLSWYEDEPLTGQVEREGWSAEEILGELRRRSR